MAANEKPPARPVDVYFFMARLLRRGDGFFPEQEGSFGRNTKEVQPESFPDRDSRDIMAGENARKGGRETC